jgi:hypothetical protein
MEQKIIKNLIIKWLNYSYNLLEEPKGYGILRIFQCMEDVIELAKISDKEKTCLLELIQQGNNYLDNLDNFNCKGFREWVNKIVYKVDD